MTKSLSDISRDMKQIDFCTLATHAPNGTIGARPMSNNREVDFDGTSRFFTYRDRQMVADIERDPKVGLTYLGSAGLKGILGAPGQFIHVEGEAEVISDKARFEKHWDSSLDRWFPEGPDTPGTVMLQVTATRVHYWDGEDEGEVPLPDRTASTEGH
ncbi:pyridoxamine 5'-phosphate oxidase family protein [Tsuneonella sp. YG55]|uniref:Pyridoxamine 5'-phosphate oxidase family protein n=1 Tax=Tsuneonella litorea TaxID=2976475 RepID=A0A9X3A7K8_9SPHN|nr:pyridoxamine 5'-phosphate oxidase family protein [Tsuneonella litorea]MCT2558511.1 pyridoxamine 5'-phosphate oxidase family protein [Tsuneonella litorea]